MSTFTTETRRQNPRMDTNEHEGGLHFCSSVFICGFSSSCALERIHLRRSVCDGGGMASCHAPRAESPCHASDSLRPFRKCSSVHSWIINLIHRQRFQQQLISAHRMRALGSALAFRIHLGRRVILAARIAVQSPGQILDLDRRSFKRRPGDDALPCHDIASGSILAADRPRQPRAAACRRPACAWRRGRARRWRWRIRAFAITFTAATQRPRRSEIIGDLMRRGNPGRVGQRGHQRIDGGLDNAG